MDTALVAQRVGVAGHGAHGRAVFFVAQRVIVVVARQSAGRPCALVVARERAVELRPRELARLLAGFSALKWYPGDACMAACAARSQETLAEFSPDCLSTYIRAVGQFRRKLAPGGDLLVAMAGRLHDWRAAGGMPTAEVVQLLKAFAGLGRHPGDGVVGDTVQLRLDARLGTPSGSGWPPCAPKGHTSMVNSISWRRRRLGSCRQRRRSHSRVGARSGRS